MRHVCVILIFILLSLPHSAKAMWEPAINLLSDATGNVNIDAPVAGQVVQGSVVIRGNTIMDGFKSYEVDFSYSELPTPTRFLIQESSVPIENGILAVWDTTTISDGEYTLTLVVNQTDGNKVEVSLPALRVRNYSPIETDTPTPLTPLMTLAPGKPTFIVTAWNTPIPSGTPYPPTPTALPTNPVEISSSQAILTLGRGAVFSIGVFAILGVYLGIRLMLQKRK
jgi:hypothetical protein